MLTWKFLLVMHNSEPFTVSSARQQLSKIKPPVRATSLLLKWKFVSLDIKKGEGSSEFMT